MGSHRIGPARDNSLLKGAFATHPQFPTCCLPAFHSLSSGPEVEWWGRAMLEECEGCSH